MSGYDSPDFLWFLIVFIPISAHLILTTGPHWGWDGTSTSIKAASPLQVSQRRLVWLICDSRIKELQDGADSTPLPAAWHWLYAARVANNLESRYGPRAPPRLMRPPLSLHQPALLSFFLSMSPCLTFPGLALCFLKYGKVLEAEVSTHSGQSQDQSKGPMCCWLLDRSWC